MNMVGFDGKPMEPVRTSAEQADAMLRLRWIPRRLQIRVTTTSSVSYIVESGSARGQCGSSLNASGRWAAAATHAATMTDRQDLRYVREALGKEANPAASESQIKAYGLGVLDIPGAGKEKYKVEWAM